MISRERLIEMYSAYPDALESDVALALTTLSNDTERVIHNEAMQRIGRMISTQEGQQLMWKNVTEAILVTARQEARKNGGQA
jgi:hypothetical protein